MGGKAVKMAHKVDLEVDVRDVAQSCEVVVVVVLSVLIRVVVVLLRVSLGVVCAPAREVSLSKPASLLN